MFGSRLQGKKFGSGVAKRLLNLVRGGYLKVKGCGAGVAADKRPALAAGVAGVVVVTPTRPLEVGVPLTFQAAGHLQRSDPAG